MQLQHIAPVANTILILVMGFSGIATLRANLNLFMKQLEELVETLKEVQKEQEELGTRLTKVESVCEVRHKGKV